MDANSGFHRHEVILPDDRDALAQRLKGPPARRTGAGALPYDEAVVRLLRGPRCGDEMVDHGGELWCLTGGMGLSQTVRAELEDICENDAIPPGQLPEKVSELGGTWYCPADGTLMHFASHALPVCAACDRALTWHVAWQLIERHPHHR